MHGLFIKWTDKPDPSGTPEVEIEFTANYRAALQCYQSSTKDGGWQEEINTKLKTSIETAGGKVHQYDLVAATADNVVYVGVASTNTIYDFYVQWTDGTKKDGIRAQAVYGAKVGTKTSETTF